MKSFNIDIIFPWEVGMGLVVFGLFLIMFGIKQSKKSKDDFINIPLIKPTTKIFLGGVFLIFGGIQMLSLLK
tara:strand:- start:320 stop:535 length:216 start_codon:yes stop_codon:yes gene_type:complete